MPFKQHVLLLIVFTAVFGCTLQDEQVKPQDLEIISLLEEAQSLLLQDHEAAIIISNKAVDLVKKGHRPDLAGYVYNTHGYICFEAAQYREAMDAFIEATAHAKEDSEELAYANYYIGYIFYKTGLYEQISEPVHNAIGIWAKDGKSAWLFRSNLLLSAYHVDQQNFEQAKAYAEKAYELASGERNMSMIALKRLTFLSIEAGKIQDASRYALKLESLDPESETDAHLRLLYYQGRIAQLTMDHAKAVSKFSNLFDEMQDQKDSDLFAPALYAFAQSLDKTGDTNKAKELLEASLPNLSQHIAEIDAVNGIYTLLEKLYFEGGEHKKARKCQQILLSLNQDYKHQSQAISSLYERAHILASFRGFEEKQKLQQEAKERSRLLTLTFSMVALILLSILAVITVKYFKVKRGYLNNQLRLDNIGEVLLEQTGVRVD